MHTRKVFGTALSWGTATALLLSLLAAPLAAQSTGTVRGKVTAANSLRPLVGAQVLVEGTGRGTLTNSAGEFLVVGVPAGTHTVRVQMLGYESGAQEVSVSAGEAATANFQLRETAIALDEVVVTGQGRESRRREIAASVASVDASELETAPITNVSEMLQGRTPGVTVLPGGGKVGQGTKIVLRGPASLSQGIQPLIYVDGVRMDNSRATGVWTGGEGWTGLDDINPADIERVEIVKGAAAATLYGTEASAGVIQIFTKKGKQNTQNWNYSSQFGSFSTPRDWWGVSVYSDWFYDNYVKSGQMQEQQLSTSGGRDGFSYYASGTYRTQEGILPGNAEDYKAFRANLQLFPREDLVVSLSSAYSQRSVAMPQDANNIYGYGINALTAGARGLFMPIHEIPLIDVDMASGRYTGGITAEYTPFDAFTNRLTVGADITNYDNTEFHPYGANDSNPFGRKTNYRRNATTVTVDYSGVLKASLSPTITSTTTAGFQAALKELGASDASGQDFPVPGLSTVGSAAVVSGWETRQSIKSAGFVLQQDFGLWDRLFFNVGARADGHSAFGDDYPYQIYPKGGISYVLSEHAFMPDFFDSFRLRTAYGTAGRQPGSFDAVRTWDAIAAMEGVPAVTPDNLGNPKLAPEVSHEFEAGLDASMFQGRLGVDLTYFDQRTERALLPRQYPPSDGFVGTQLENIGKIKNRGLELALNGTLVQRENFSWDANLNLTKIENEVTDLGGLPELYEHWTQVNRVGYPVASYFGDRYVVRNGEVVEVRDEPFLTDENGELLLDENGRPIPNRSNPGFIGPAFPTTTFQLGTQVSLWNRLNVRALLDHSGGHFVESSSVRWLTRTKVVQGDSIVGEQYWGKPAASWCHTSQDQVVQAMCETPWPASGRGNVVRPADYWKLREVTVSYTLPQSMLSGAGFRNTEIYLTGRNLWRKIDGMLMEAEANYDTTDDLSQQEYFNTPMPRQFVVGLRLGF